MKDPTKLVLPKYQLGRGTSVGVFLSIYKEPPTPVPKKIGIDLVPVPVLIISQV
jgi:hypothetical protein